METMGKKKPRARRAFTPEFTTMASQAEVYKLAAGGGARVDR